MSALHNLDAMFSKNSSKIKILVYWWLSHPSELNASNMIDWNVKTYSIFYMHSIAMSFKMLTLQTLWTFWTRSASLQWLAISHTERLVTMFVTSMYTANHKHWCVLVLAGNQCLRIANFFSPTNWFNRLQNMSFLPEYRTVTQYHTLLKIATHCYRNWYSSFGLPEKIRSILYV